MSLMFLKELNQIDWLVGWLVGFYGISTIAGYLFQILFIHIN